MALWKEILVEFWFLKSEGYIPLDSLDTHRSIILKSSQRNRKERMDWLYMAQDRDISRNLVKTTINLEIP